MTDEEMAEKYRKSLKQKLIDEDEFERLEMFDENVEEAYLAGLKAARQEKWHDLRKNPDDLPEENQEVLVLFTLPDKSKNDVITAQFENNDFNFVDLQDVIAWCEIPTFEE